MIEKELKKIEYILSKINETKDLIQGIENKIIEDDLNTKNVYLEFIIYLLSTFCITSLMLYLHKYILFFVILIVSISIIFFLYYLSVHLENRVKEKKLSSLITDKLNYENILDNIPKEETLLKKKNELLKKGKTYG